MGRLDRFSGRPPGRHLLEDHVRPERQAEQQTLQGYPEDLEEALQQQRGPHPAARLCWKLVAKDRFIGCVMDNLEEPEDAMKWCTQFVCSGMTDKASCNKLGNAIDRCQELNTLSIAVRKTCKPKLRINN